MADGPLQRILALAIPTLAMTDLVAQLVRIVIHKGWQEWQFAVQTVSKKLFSAV